MKKRQKTKEDHITMLEAKLPKWKKIQSARTKETWRCQLKMYQLKAQEKLLGTIVIIFLDYYSTLIIMCDN